MSNFLKALFHFMNIILSFDGLELMNLPMQQLPVWKTVSGDA